MKGIVKESNIPATKRGYMSHCFLEDDAYSTMGIKDLQEDLLIFCQSPSSLISLHMVSARFCECIAKLGSNNPLQEHIKVHYA